MNCIEEAWREINSVPLKEWKEKNGFYSESIAFFQSVNF